MSDNSLAAPRSDIEALEATVQQTLRSGDESGLTVLGYGEITTVLKWRSQHGDFACKRLTPFPHEAAAEHCANVIHLYVEELRRHGIDVADTQISLIPRNGGSVVVYCVQPILPSAALGPNYLREKENAEAAAIFERILSLLRNAVTTTLAPDGQLSNWAFVDDRIVYMDVSSPFLRDEDGRELFDFDQQMRSLPAPLRFPVRRFVVKGILDNYYTLRGQALDFLGNLKKERLEHLIPVFLPIANRALALEPPISEADIRAYYASDARTYAWIQAARRADRWVHRRILRRPYEYLLPPRVERNR